MLWKGLWVVVLWVGLGWRSISHKGCSTLIAKGTQWEQLHMTSFPTVSMKACFRPVYNTAKGGASIIPNAMVPYS